MAELNEGDWVEGAPKWWWKYVFPTPESFWSQIVARLGPVPDPWLQAEPDPHPWLQKVTGEVLEGLVMLRASAHADEATAIRLKNEAVGKINQAVAGVRQA